MTDNPLAAGERVRAVPPPTAMVVFGGSGDLAHRKIVPALYNLELHRLLPQNFAFVGSSRSEFSDDEYRADMRKAVEEFSRTQPIQHQVWESFASKLHYVSGSSSDPATYGRVGDVLDRFDREQGTDGNRLFYLSLIPKLFPDTIRGIGKAGLGGRGWDRGFSRVVVEKPFGHDLTSARELQELVTTVFPERDVFRIDHYLGKESVQNIIAFRFANGIFEPVWNHHYVDHVQVTVSESLGIEHRGNFYETAGAIRDIFQNHELQVLALIAMEPPATFEPEDVRNEKAKVLKALRHLEGEAVDRGVVRGQYGPGWIDGKEVPGYREEPDVHPDSVVETYVAAELRVDNWRWAGTPFYVRTGKRLP
ncbi:MAG: glucose-6-phosphate dehydrogenase, partial [Actinomycetota bacterium]